MDYNIERKVLVCESNNEKNKDKWTIQEFAEDGITIDGSYEAWKGTVTFIASELKLITSVSNHNVNEKYEDDEAITGVLHTKNNYSTEEYYITPLSILGTKRSIKNIDLIIKKIDEENKDDIEKCKLWGCISYDYEIDWKIRTSEDNIQINIHLNANRFNNLADIIRFNKSELVRLNVWNISGFYSQWDPNGDTDKIKVLVDKEDQQIIFPENCTINPPELGNVGGFYLSFYQTQKLDLNNSLPNRKLLDDEKNEGIKLHLSLLEYLKQNEVALKQLSIDIKEKEFTINGVEYLKNLEYLKYIDEFTMNIHSVNKLILKQLTTNENALENISRNLKENKLVIENFESSQILNAYMTRNENLLIKTHKILWLIFVLLLSIFIKLII